MAGLAERLRVGGPARDLRLGDTFNKASKAQAYHTIRYDFKPQSIDNQKMGTVEVEENHEVTIAVPHREGSGLTQTVFKGNEKPIAKECLLIIDHNTGEISLERISTHINVKKTREEGSSRITSHRPPTPLMKDHKTSPPQKFSPSHTSRGPGPPGSPPSRSRPSPSHHKVSPPTKMSPHRNSSSVPSKSPSNSFMPSMGGIGSMPMFDMGTPTPVSEAKAAETGVMSDSSSDSSSNSGSSSSSDSDSDSEGEKQAPAPAPAPAPTPTPTKTPPKGKANGHSNKIQSAFGNNSDSDSEPDDPPPSSKKQNSGQSGGPPMVQNLNDDLMLSEDDSDDSD